MLLSDLLLLVDYDDKQVLKIGPNLHRSDVLPSHFIKMRVSKATSVFSLEVVAALRYLSDLLNISSKMV